jgi:predicted amidohydrolase YtcJ
LENLASLILTHANIITCEPGQPAAEALAIRGERILWLGKNEEADRYKAPNTRVIDCQGKTLVPGFIDAHCHVFSLVRQLFSLDLSPRSVRSIEDIKDVIRRKTQFTPEGRWIRGTDYNEFYLAEKRHPTRSDLDDAAPDHPVVISHRSLHARVLNTLALRLVGITSETEEPPGGLIERDLDTGEPNGILFEMGDYLQSRISSPMSQTELDWGISEANRQYLSLGITSIGEATVTNDLGQWGNCQQLSAARKLRSRINMMIGAQSLDEFRKAGLTTGSGDGRLRLGSVKVVLSEARGTLQPSQNELNAIVLEAIQKGFQVAIHAVEKNTVKAAIEALEYSTGKLEERSISKDYAIDSEGKSPLKRELAMTNPAWGLMRPRIEHCSECPPELISRLKRMGAVIVSQPPFIYYHGERYLTQVPAEIQQWLYPFKSLLEKGLCLAGSSDSPVVPNNPLVGIYAAVTRQAESGQLLLPRERLTSQQALEMYTLNAAYASFEENEKGSLSPGKLADIVMLSSDPLNSPPELLKETKVKMTVLGGEVAWESQ